MNQYIKVKQAQVNCERCLSAYNMFLSVYYFSSVRLGIVRLVLDHWIAIKSGADIHYSQRMRPTDFYDSFSTRVTIRLTYVV